MIHQQLFDMSAYLTCHVGNDVSFFMGKRYACQMGQEMKIFMLTKKNNCVRIFKMVIISVFWIDY